MSEITELKIAPSCSWRGAGPDNPLKCTVRVRSKETVVETVLTREDTDRMLALVADIVAKAAAKNIADFRMAVAPSAGPGQMIEGEKG